MDKGLLVIVSGFSGAGKGTIVKGLLEKYDNYSVSVSATTRAPRAGEVDGRDYFFISREEFEQRIKEGDFLEYNEYSGNYYGTPKKYVLSQLEKGTNLILEIDVHGGFNVKKVYPEVKMVFVTTADRDVLLKRLQGRGTETEEQIEKRLQIAEKEKEFMKEYDYILVNDKLDEAIDELNAYITKED